MVFLSTFVASAAASGHFTCLVLCLGGQRVDVAALERELGGSCHCETIDLRDARIEEIAPGGARHAALLAAAKALNAKGTLKGVFLLELEEGF